MEYKYKFQGQERQDELGLNVTAMDFRMYDNALGRFHNIDAMTEVMPSLSPYRFAFNNPVIWKDPSGLSETSDVVEEHWDLDEVVVTAKARKSYHNTRPADFGTYHLAKGLNTERFKGTLQQYNKTFGTDFKNYDDWYYRALYVPFRNEMINDMHSAQAKAGQAIMLLVGSVFAAPILVASSPAAISAVSATISHPVAQTSLALGASNALSQQLINGKVDQADVAISMVPGGAGVQAVKPMFSAAIDIISFNEYGIKTGGGFYRDAATGYIFHGLSFGASPANSLRNFGEVPLNTVLNTGQSSMSNLLEKDGWK